MHTGGGRLERSTRATEGARARSVIEGYHLSSFCVQRHRLAASCRTSEAIVKIPKSDLAFGDAPGRSQLAQQQLQLVFATQGIDVPSRRSISRQRTRRKAKETHNKGKGGNHQAGKGLGAGNCNAVGHGRPSEIPIT